MLKFVHAADTHIDSALSGLSAHDNAVPDLMRTATRSAFSNLIDRTIAEKAAFLLLVGDVFDTAWKESNTGMFFVREMARLNVAKIQVVMLRGNHDAANEMTKSLPLTPNVHILSSEAPETVRFDLDGVRVAVHGQSFKHAETTQNLLSKYPAPLDGYLNIGMLHTGLEGNTPHGNYAPCSLDELKNKGYAYFALGHIHLHQIHCEAPWVVMPGNLQGRHVQELGPRGAMLVSYENGELQPPQRIFVDVLRWQMAEVDISTAKTRDDVVAQAGVVFRQLLDDADGRPLACRVTLTGKSAAHGALFGQEQLLRAELTAQAINVGGEEIWIEKVKVRSEPATDALVIAARGDALSELQALLGDAAKDPEFLASLESEFAVLLSKMPHDIYRQEVPALRAVRDGDFATLIREIAPSVLDRITLEA